ncbi:phosphotransferase [Actinopolymorpha sp. B9G3]|uniref:phosphotransferase enzyme family protein n=1 Tax=Actinopolymorpha sp. B9G3 TaxID=3158970 RepID=UPI0032D93F24
MDDSRSCPTSGLQTGFLERVAREFELGTPVAAEPLRGGGAEVVKLTTPQGSFVVKPVYRVPDWELYAVVERALNARGVRQARLFRTPSGAVASASGHCVQEFLTAVMTERPNRRQTDRAMRHLAAYDEALATIPLTADHVPVDQVLVDPVPVDPAPVAWLTADTLWTRVVSPTYLGENLPRLVRDHAPRWVDPNTVAEGLALLAAAAPEIAALPRQLVHGDIGPDNVLYDGDEVVAIVDFTPYHESALFGLGSALYWFHVHPGGSDQSGGPVHPGGHRRSGGLDVDQVRASVAAYDEGRALTSTERTLVVPMLLREALRRFATPLAGAEALGGPVPEGATHQRYDALLEVLALARDCPFISGDRVHDTDGDLRPEKEH